MLVPEVSRVLEATAGSVVTIKLPPREEAQGLWEKYSHENWPVIIGHDPGPDHTGRTVGPRSIYSFPRTEDGLIKIGYRVTKVSHVVSFQPAPKAKSTVVYELRQAARL